MNSVHASQFTASRDVRVDVQSWHAHAEQKILPNHLAFDEFSFFFLSFSWKYRPSGDVEVKEKHH